jgi:hypothetical protein
MADKTEPWWRATGTESSLHRLPSLAPHRTLGPGSQARTLLDWQAVLGRLLESSTPTGDQLLKGLVAAGANVKRFRTVGLVWPEQFEVAIRDGRRFVSADEPALGTRTDRPVAAAFSSARPALGITQDENKTLLEIFDVSDLDRGHPPELLWWASDGRTGCGGREQFSVSEVAPFCLAASIPGAGIGSSFRLVFAVVDEPISRVDQD